MRDICTICNACGESMRACMHAFMHACTYICNTCKYKCMCTCMCACMRACGACVHSCMHARAHACKYVRMGVCIYMRLCAMCGLRCTYGMHRVHGAPCVHDMRCLYWTPQTMQTCITSISLNFLETVKLFHHTVLNGSHAVWSYIANIAAIWIITTKINADWPINCPFGVNRCVACWMVWIHLGAATINNLFAIILVDEQFLFNICMHSSTFSKTTLTWKRGIVAPGYLATFDHQIGWRQPLCEINHVHPKSCRRTSSTRTWDHQIRPNKFTQQNWNQ